MLGSALEDFCNGIINRVERHHLLLVPTLVLIAFYLGRKYSTSVAHLDSKSNLVGQQPGWFPHIWAKYRYVFNGYRLVYDAFNEQTEGKKILRIPIFGQKLYMLPAKYVDELKSLPEATLSSSYAVSDYFLGSYTTLDHSMFGDSTWRVVRDFLTRRLSMLVAPLSEECIISFEEEFPICEDWTLVDIHSHLLKIIGRMTSRVFVGNQLSSDPSYRQTCIDYATCVFQASGLLKAFPAMLRPTLCLFNPHIWRIRFHYLNAKRHLLSEIAQRRQSAVKQENMLDWLIANSGSEDPLGIVKRQLGLSFAAIHTTTNHLTNVLLDLAARWDQYAPELIEEITQALSEDEAVLKKSTLSKLSKLDSFMKESQRLNPPSALSFNRKLMRPLILSDGTYLPESSYIAAPSGPLGQSDDHFLRSSDFDGFRFHRKRQKATGLEKSATYFTSTGIHSMVFGHGRFACPGRFFASLESKTVLVYILLNYRLSLPGDGSRSPNLTFMDALFPDPKQKVMFRRCKPYSIPSGGKP
ncbi:cytochrome P450 [Delitschia confertaspora ATCC 74209]|uniref:Cytochrome P450 n=1 Tax=Delitschia confertaspora ATCC 74209 TaxID=1513339 RepID=A0A9P4MS18_9PLEO|nr:cytochrome P450 [Delitschia confertaspora ATCC 74209]